MSKRVSVFKTFSVDQNVLKCFHFTLFVKVRSMALKSVKIFWARLVPCSKILPDKLISWSYSRSIYCVVRVPRAQVNGTIHVKLHYVYMHAALTWQRIRISIKNSCRQLTSYCSRQCWLRCITPNDVATQIAKFMASTWAPPGSCRPQMGPMLAPWTLLSG